MIWTKKKTQYIYIEDAKQRQQIWNFPSAYFLFVSSLLSELILFNLRKLGKWYSRDLKVETSQS